MKIPDNPQCVYADPPILKDQNSGDIPYTTFIELIKPRVRMLDESAFGEWIASRAPHLLGREREFATLSEQRKGERSNPPRRVLEYYDLVVRQSHFAEHPDMMRYNLAHEFFESFLLLVQNVRQDLAHLFARQHEYQLAASLGQAEQLYRFHTTRPNLIPDPTIQIAFAVATATQQILQNPSMLQMT